MASGFIGGKFQYFKMSHVVRDLLENACDVIVISLAQDDMEVKKKLVSDTESVLANLTSKAVEVINMLTSPHDHFQWRYCLGAMCTNTSGTKQPVIKKNIRP